MVALQGKLWIQSISFSALHNVGWQELPTLVSCFFMGDNMKTQIISIMAATSIMLSGCGSQTAPTKTPTREEYKTAIAEREAKKFSEHSINESDSPVGEQDTIPTLSLDKCIEAAKNTLSNNFGENCLITVADTIVNISVWRDGIIAGATAAKNNDLDAKESWDALIAGASQLQKSIQEYFDACGYSNYTVAFNILNDLNTDNVLFTVVKGIVMLDFVNDINLLGIQ